MLSAVPSSLLLVVLKKTILFFGFKNLYKKIRETKKLESIHEYHFVERENKGRKLDKNSSLLRLECMPETSTKNAVPEFQLW
jgi:hypothetical protein